MKIVNVFSFLYPRLVREFDHRITIYKIIRNKDIKNERNNFRRNLGSLLSVGTFNSREEQNFIHTLKR